MNDFLGNLLARSERIPSGVRPRLATRFEPPPLASAEFEIANRPAPPVEAREEHFSDPPNRPGPVSLGIREAARPAPLNQPPALTPAPPPVLTPGERAEPAFQAPSPPLLAPAGPVIPRADFGGVPAFAPQAADRAAEREPVLPPEPPAGRREILTERVILKREVVRERDPLASQAHSPTITPQAGEAVSAPAGRSQDPPGAASGALETIRATRLSPPARSLSPAGGLDAPALPASPPPGPTIEVTIGRIEVRATPPPAQPARERKPRAALSLEEYMRQRNGGRG